jgi:hypothetical protein
MKKLIIIFSLLLLYIINYAQSDQQTLNPLVANPGSTANLREVRRVINHNDSALFAGSGVSVVNKIFNDTITFANLVSNYNTINATSDIIVNLDTSDSQPGNGSILSIVGDGIHSVTFNGFSNYDPSITFDNTLDVDNQIVFTCIPTKNGKKFTYRIINQVYSNVAPTAIVTQNLGVSGVSLGDTIYGHYAYDDLDGDLQGTSTKQWYSASSYGGVYSVLSGETDLDYIIDNAGNFKYIKLGVTPVALTGTSPGELTFPDTAYLVGDLDADATAYLQAISIPNDGTVFYSSTAYQITGAEIWVAVQAFFQGLKTDTLWTKFEVGKHFMYLYIGGDSTKHSYNAIDPRNLDAAFRITWNGATLTHDGSGINPNGTSGFGNTHLVPNTVGLSATSTSLSTYVIGATGSAISYEMGCNSAAGNAIYYAPCYGGNTEYSNLFGAAGTNYSNPTSLPAFYVDSRTASNLQRSYKNAVFKDDNTAANGTATSTRPLYIFAYNNNGTTAYYSTRKHGLDALSAGMTESNVIKWTNRVNALQTALHRNVF